MRARLIFAGLELIDSKLALRVVSRRGYRGFVTAEQGIEASAQALKFRHRQYLKKLTTEHAEYAEEKQGCCFRVFRVFIG
jgi:hypothetical protein